MTDFSKLKLTQEMLEKIEDCATPEELLQLAKDNGVELSLEEAKQALDTFDRDLTDEELEKVAGGNEYNPRWQPESESEYYQ